VSSLLIFELFVAGLIERLGGVCSPSAPFGRRRRARLARQVASKPGREDWVRVALREDAEGLVAVPVRGGTAAISSIVQSDGVVCIGMQEEGLPAGADVEVCLWP
jgi:molybdopterin molybdotransferase